MGFSVDTIYDRLTTAVSYIQVGRNVSSVSGRHRYHMVQLRVLSRNDIMDLTKRLNRCEDVAAIFFLFNGVWHPCGRVTF